MIEHSSEQNDRWLLPEGIEELLPNQVQLLEQLRRKILDCYHRWGYQQIMPPFIEYLESLLTGTGKDLDLQTFKVTDPSTSRLMGIRADMTPQAARYDAHILKQDIPTRLCYMGTVLRTRTDGFFGSRAPLQIGAELYGHAGYESDLEVLELMLETLYLTGLQSVHLDLGHVGIYRSLAKQANLNESREAILFDALQRKAKPEIDNLLEQWSLDKRDRDRLTCLSDLNGDQDVLLEARKILKSAPEPVHQALNDMEHIATQLNSRRPDVRIHFDLAELRGYNYQTGIVFAAFVPSYGQEIARGGRYDDIGKIFGRSRPATGFSADLKTIILQSSQLPEPAPEDSILAPWGADPDLNQTIAQLRANGERVIVQLPGGTVSDEDHNHRRKLCNREGQWVVEKR